MRLIENFTAGTPKTFHKPGNFFYLDSLSLGFATIRFFRDGARLDEDLTDVVAGWHASPPGGFDQVEITPTITQAISFYIAKGVVGSNVFSGNVSVSNVPAFTYGANFVSNTVLTANVSQQVFAPGANPNGAILWDAQMFHVQAVGSAQLAIAAHTAAPNSVTVGDVLSLTDGVMELTGPLVRQWARVSRPTSIPSGKGLYFTANQTEGQGQRCATYTLL
jgi:hypothetical protein